jgi:hypothetical protein
MKTFLTICVLCLLFAFITPSVSQAGCGGVSIGFSVGFPIGYGGYYGGGYPGYYRCGVPRHRYYGYAPAYYYPRPAYYHPARVYRPRVIYYGGY